MFPEIDKRVVGLRLKSILRQKKITAKDVQEYLSLSCVQTVYRWMEGINIPCIDHLYALSILLDVSMDYLVGGKETENLVKACIRSVCGDGFVYRTDCSSFRSTGDEKCGNYLYIQKINKKIGKERVLVYRKKTELWIAA